MKIEIETKPTKITMSRTTHLSNHSSKSFLQRMSIDIHDHNFRQREIPIYLRNTNFIALFTSELNPSQQMTLSLSAEQKLGRAEG